MVKRTLFVLGILSIAVMVAGTSFAFMGGRGAACGDGMGEMAMWVPAPCCPYPVPKTIVKTWEAKISAPVPVAGFGCGPGYGGFGHGKRGRGFLTNVAPFRCADILFGGWDGVRGCGDMPGGPCGVKYGPLPGALVGLFVKGCPCKHLYGAGHGGTVFGGIF